MNIPAVATSITVMIGGTTTGPLNQATLVNSFAQFQTTFGALQTTLELGYSVMLFFANGGQQCWVVRQGTDMDAALNALDTVAILNLLCAPGVTDSGLQAKIAAYAEKRMALALLDAEVAAANPSLLLQYAPEQHSDTISKCCSIWPMAAIVRSAQRPNQNHRSIRRRGWNLRPP